MIPFWREDPLSQAESELLSAVGAAHAQAAMRNSISTVAVANTAAGSNSYANAISAALLSIGGLHAPLVQMMRLLASPDDELQEQCMSLLARGRRLPGFGSSFVKGPDADWQAVEALIVEQRPKLMQRGVMMLRLLHDRGTEAYPNPAFYTAAAALILAMPASVAPYLFLAGRLESWSKVFVQNEKTKLTPE